MVFLLHIEDNVYFKCGGGELRLYALYVIDLLVENIEHVLRNVIVLRNFSDLGLLAGSFIHL